MKHNNMVSTILLSMIVTALSVLISVIHDFPADNTSPCYYSKIVEMISSSYKQWKYSTTPTCKMSSHHQQHRLRNDTFHQQRQNRSMRNRLSFLFCIVLLQQFSFLIQPSYAFVYVNNITYPSLPALFGRYMMDGKVYEARLQYFHDNPTLCDIDEKTISKFVPPVGGVQINHFGGSNLTIYEESVALLVVRGNCPFQRKAFVAESIDESIKVLLIANFNLDNVPEDEDKLIPMYSQHGDTRLVLLSISHATGQALKKYLSEIPSNITKLGGPIIQFDSTPPYGMLTEADLESMMFSALGIFFMLISFTGCLVILTGTYHQLLMHHNSGSNNPITAATQRRLLTEDEVQQFTTSSSSNRTPSEDLESPLRTTASTPHTSQISSTVSNNIGLNNNDATLDNVEEDQCAVCIGEFDDDDDDIAILPCQHKFHTTCITPWLTERQSKCPLCKFDVLQYIRDQHTPSNAVTALTPVDGAIVADDSQLSTTPTSTVSFWDQLRRYRWTSIATTYNENDQHHQSQLADGVMRVVEALSANDFILDYDYDDDDNHPNYSNGFELAEQRRHVVS
jgi:Ring finger domain